MEKIWGRDGREQSQEGWGKECFIANHTWKHLIQITVQYNRKCSQHQKQGINKWL